MKIERTLRKFILAMTALGLSLVLLWGVFYFHTIQTVKKNAGVQAGAESEAIMSRIEDELQSVEETLYTLAHYDRMIELVKLTNPIDFYDNADVVTTTAEEIIGNDNPASDIVVFGQNGTYYRIRGKCSNTVLTRIQNILGKGKLNNFYVNGNGATYIGSAREITENGVELGYVTLLLDKTKLEYIFSDYSDIDYMGIILMSKDQILCANRSVQMEDIERIKKESVIYKEQVIGLTGLTLLVFCENTLSQNLKGYFRIALPVMIFILILLIIFYIYYWNKKALKPQERELMESRMKVQEVQLENERTLTGLLKKQISAHFTVNTLTVVRALINKGEKDEATHMCDELSWLLRYSNAPDELISLMNECYVLEQYVGIMKVRYPDRIVFHAELDDFFDEVYIPRMILQPIIENAIMHGQTSNGPIEITLSAEKTQDLLITISDSGKGVSGETLEEIRNSIVHPEKNGTEGIKGIALANIQKRIHIACGTEYGIEIDSEKGVGTIVKIRLKLMHNEAK